MVNAFVVFVLSVGLNALFKLVTPNIGAYRRGFDTILFCAIVTGYVGGIKSGVLFGVLIALSYYALRSSQWDHALYVIPLAGLTGAVAGIVSFLPLFTLALLLFVMYHGVGIGMNALVYHTLGPRYAWFLGVNAVTTFILLRAFAALQ